MSGYRVRYADDDLMDGHDFVLCHEHEDGVTLFIRRGVRNLPEDENILVWERAWAAYRELAEVDALPNRMCEALA